MSFDNHSVFLATFAAIRVASQCLYGAPMGAILFDCAIVATVFAIMPIVHLSDSYIFEEEFMPIRKGIAMLLLLVLYVFVMPLHESYYFGGAKTKGFDFVIPFNLIFAMIFDVLIIIVFAPNSDFEDTDDLDEY